MPCGKQGTTSPCPGAEGRPGADRPVALNHRRVAAAAGRIVPGDERVAAGRRRRHRHGARGARRSPRRVEDGEGDRRRARVCEDMGDRLAAAALAVAEVPHVLQRAAVGRRRSAGVEGLGAVDRGGCGCREARAGPGRGTGRRRRRRCRVVVAPAAGGEPKSERAGTGDQGAVHQAANVDGRIDMATPLMKCLSGGSGSHNPARNA